MQGVAAMRTSAIVMALFLVGSAGIGRAPAVLGQTGAGWVTLFDGKNFNNWTMTGNANWHIADGIAEADVPRGFLVSRQSYGDFELRAEVWARPESNGGILFRITDPRDPGIENGYELNINDTRKDQDGRTGSIVNVAKPLVKFDSGNIWTTVEIRAVGPKMTARLNGTLTAEATDSKYARGPVALQAAGGLVRYRNVQIREIK
ncbi:MAG: 3-keto-disaccharide hydrolase [Vicinamibacterales bacterium]